MKKKWVSILCIAGMCMTAIPVMAEEQENSTETVVFVHTNDVHGHVDAEGYVKAIADSYKEEYGENQVYTVSAGDVFAGGESIAHMTDGESIVEIMNAADYDALTVGNNDIPNGLEWLLHMDEETEFPILAANLVTNGLDPELGEDGEHPLAEYTIFQTDAGTKIGVFGVTTVLSPPTDETTPFTKTGTIETAQACVDALQAEDCDIIIALAHTGWPDNDDTYTAVSANDANSYQLAMEVDGIDVVIDGHTHSVINDGNGFVCENEKQTLIVQTGCFGDNIGIVKLTIDPDSKTITEKSETQLTAAEYSAEYEADAEVTAVVDKWQDYMDETYGVVVGSTDSFLNAERASASEDAMGIRMAEETMGNLVTDAVRDATGADISWFSGVRIRASIEAGDITLMDCYNVFANGGTICGVNWTGAQIVEYLESCIAEAAQGQESVSFKQVSGICFSYDETGKITEITLEDGTPLDEETEYYVTGEFGNPPEDAEQLYDGAEALVQLFKDYLNSEAYDTSKYADKLGRIIPVAAAE
jgi:5'-nucleotidase